MRKMIDLEIINDFFFQSSMLHLFLIYYKQVKLKLKQDGSEELNLFESLW